MLRRAHQRIRNPAFRDRKARYSKTALLSGYHRRSDTSYSSSQFLTVRKLITSARSNTTPAATSWRRRTPSTKATITSSTAGMPLPGRLLLLGTRACRIREIAFCPVHRARNHARSADGETIAQAVQRRWGRRRSPTLDEAADPKDTVASPVFNGAVSKGAWSEAMARGQSATRDGSRPDSC